ncbi:MAG TPA: hypothetical protein VLW85_26120 [Myxococcales bacterium]|nr:hypothetical protein [Myxococcales bacterium]
MGKFIAVVNLVNGEALQRENDTLTLDFPPDFDQQTGGVFVDADRLGRYRTTKGETRVYGAAPKRLSGRDAGEECLVAAQEVDSSGSVCTRLYWRSVVNPCR